MSDFIREFWDSQAKLPGADASWGDSCAIALEIEQISRYIRDGDTVLDVGCANGFALARQCDIHRIKRAVGVDFSPKMIEAANQKGGEFYQSDVRNLPFPDQSFDVVYTTRCLINLPSWKDQMQGIRECLRVSKRTVVLSEGFYEPLQRLNSIRMVLGLPLLYEHDFNRYLKKSRLQDFLSDLGVVWKCVDFSSVYYMGSRVMRELCTDPSAYSGYSNPMNIDFYELQKKYSGGGVGIQQAYVIDTAH